MDMNDHSRRRQEATPKGVPLSKGDANFTIKDQINTSKVHNDSEKIPGSPVKMPGCQRSLNTDSTGGRGKFFTRRPS